MLHVIWEYDVRPGMEGAFEALYGPDGAWAALFREHAGFVGTQLLRSDRPGRYLTIDRWKSDDAYEAFLTGARERYAAIDAQGDAMTADERRIGRWFPC